MDTVINKISDIESVAASIMEDAQTRKKAYALEMDEKTAAFDQELEAETSKKVTNLRSTIEVDMNSKLSLQETKSKTVLKKMDDGYQIHHKEYIEKLFASMIKE